MGPKIGIKKEQKKTQKNGEKKTPQPTRGLFFLAILGPKKGFFHIFKKKILFTRGYFF